MEPHYESTIFTNKGNCIAFDGSDGVDRLLPLAPKFLSRFYHRDEFLYHDASLSKTGHFANTFGEEKDLFG